MKKLFFIIAIAANFTACKNNSATNGTAESGKSVDSTPSVSAVFQSYYDERMHIFPFEATFNGISTYNDQFPIDISEAYRDTVKQFYQKYKAQLTAMRQN
jgi:hypothetical protein